MLNYLNESYIRIECYAAIGLEPLKISEGEILLKDLLIINEQKH